MPEMPTARVASREVWHAAPRDLPRARNELITPPLYGTVIGENVRAVPLRNLKWRREVHQTALGRAPNATKKQALAGFGHATA